MDSITRRLKQPSGEYAEQTFTIYKRSEAEQEGIAFKEDWRDCKAGDWGVTDDGYVMQCRAFTGEEQGDRQQEAEEASCEEILQVCCWRAYRHTQL